MNKQELIRQLAADTGIDTSQVRVVLDSLLRTTTAVLQQGDKLMFQGFGAFYPVQQTERPGRNPKTGEPKTVPSRRTAKFRPGIAFLKDLNKDKIE
ncbi:HU family DNA-binding protein [Parabacteroides sp. AF18-52]|jgi:DNA-binding protein HU-beta|nr:HU family DNA-binding protein [Parabacteroides sp. AF18-52]